jgi:hypothetical protein
MFENIQFASHLHFKFAKIAINPQKNFREKYQYGYQTKAEFEADFTFVNAGFQKSS